MRISRICIITSFILLLNACSAAHFTPVTNSQWKGRSIQQVEAKWGPANQIIQMRNGYADYIYSSNKTYSNLYPSPSITYANMAGPHQTNFAVPETSPNAAFRQETDLYCTTVLETNKKGLVIDEQHQGTNCIDPALLKSMGY